MMSTKEPLYITIMQILKERIIDGTYEINSLMPTEVELEKEFQVSKITIRNAIEMLENEGYVQKKSGKGTTILSNSIFNKLSKGSTFTQVMKRSGRQFIKEKTKISKIALEPQDELYQYYKKACTKITRMYYLDGHPYIYCTHYLPENLQIPQIEEDENFSIYMMLFKSGYLLKNIHDEFFVDYPSLKILEELNLESGPVLGRKRTTYNEHGQVIEVSYAQYNTRLANYKIEFDL